MDFLRGLTLGARITMAHKRHPSAILTMNDIVKIGSDKYTVSGFTKQHLKLVSSRGNQQTLPYSEFDEKLARYELQIIAAT